MMIDVHHDNFLLNMPDDDGCHAAGPLRTFQAYLTDQQWAKHGFVVIDKNAGLLKNQQFTGFVSTEDSRLPTLVSIRNDSSINAATYLSSKPEWLGRLDKRLAELDEAAQEEDILPSSGSRKDLLSFARRIGAARMPGVALVGNGNFRLRWKNKDGEVVGLQFRGGGEIQFLFLKRVGDKMELTQGFRLAATIERFIAACEMRHVIAK